MNKQKLSILIITLILTLACTRTNVFADELIPMEIGSFDVNEGFYELIDMYSDTKDDDISLFSLEEDSLNYATERKYDSRDRDIITSVKNQNPYGACWTFSVMSQAETSAILNNITTANKDSNGVIIDPDFSELHMCYVAYNEIYNKGGKVNPTISFSSSKSVYDLGGNDFYAISRLMNWNGIAKEIDYPFSNASIKDYSIEEDELYVHNYVLDGFYLIPTKNNNKEDVNNVIKKCITEFGSVGWSYYSGSNYYYNTTISGNKVSNYSTISSNAAGNPTNHAITVVGWDDDYPVEYFKEGNRPKNPGAWLIKNSYGTSVSDGGYFYMSYEEPTLGVGNPASVVIVEANRDDYDNNYYNSNGIISSGKTYKASGKANSVANIYTANGTLNGERIKAVSFMINTAKSDYSIQIYRNPLKDANGNVADPATGEPLLLEPQSGTTAYAGVTTVELNEEVYINHGDTFAVVLTMSEGSQVIYDTTYSRTGTVNFKVIQPAISGKSFSKTTDGIFKDENAGKADGEGRYFRLNVITDDVSLPEPSHNANSWEIRNGKKYYYDANKKTYRGWKKIKNTKGKYEKYYFENDGSVRTGFMKDSNHVYYLKNTISSLTVEEKYILKQVIYVEDLNNSSLSVYNPGLYEKVMELGVMQTGFLDINIGSDKGRYYFSSKGYMGTGWKTISYKVPVINSKGKTVKKSYKGRYYFDKVTGKMAVGVVKISDKYFYFAQDTDKYINTTDPYAVGKLKKGSIESGEKKYYTNSEGVLQSGWRKFYDSNGTKTTKDDTYTWRFFNNEMGGFSEISNYEPFIAKGEGALFKQQYPHWVSVSANSISGNDIDGRLYFCFNNNSKLNKGWKTVSVDLNGDRNKSKYYFDKKTGELYKGERKIGKRTYVFGEISGIYSSKASKYRVLKSENGKVFCYLPNGKKTTGWKTIAYRFEYLNENSGKIEFVNKTGRFYFEPDKKSEHYGEMYVGTAVIKGRTYNFSTDEHLMSETKDGMRGALIQ